MIFFLFAVLKKVKVIKKKKGFSTNKKLDDLKDLFFEISHNSLILLLTLKNNP